MCIEDSKKQIFLVFWPKNKNSNKHTKFLKPYVLRDDMLIAFMVILTPVIHKVISKSNATKNENGCLKNANEKITLKLTTWMLLSHSVASCVQFRWWYKIQTPRECLRMCNEHFVRVRMMHTIPPLIPLTAPMSLAKKEIERFFIPNISSFPCVCVHASAWFVWNWWSLCWLSVFILSIASKMVRKMHFNDRHTYYSYGLNE